MVVKQIRMSGQTRMNWLIDAGVFVSALVAALSGIYFLYLPAGGYQGGRNPLYGVTVLFDRATWDALHTWGGVLMIAAVAVHFTIHWGWVVMMARRLANGLRTGCAPMSRGAWLNLVVDGVIAVSFLVTAVSGLYFLLVPVGGYQGGRNPGWDPAFLFSRDTWDVIHTWGGVVLILAAVVHFCIHWRWVKNVTARFFRSLLPAPLAARPVSRMVRE